MIVARFRYRGAIYELPVCLTPDALERVLAHFPDRIIDWNRVRELPHVESTPEQRAELLELLERRHAYANLRPAWPPRLPSVDG